MEKLMYKRFHPVLVNPQEEQLNCLLDSTFAQVVQPGFHQLPSPSWRLKPYVEVIQEGEDTHGILWQKDQRRGTTDRLSEVKPGEPMYIYKRCPYRNREILIVTGVIYVEKDPGLFKYFAAKILSIG